ncbi:MAG: tetratricopeptide repeat protein [Planctomycetota bacterium]|jgi:tetratricopeptide (TPR) repeat protein
MAERIEQIKSLLEASPQDVFLHYSLAMEYAGLNRIDEALDEFYKCIELDSDYLAAYVEAGKCLRTAGRGDEARKVFTAGLEIAERKGEAHTCDYIRQQLDGLPRPESK